MKPVHLAEDAWLVRAATHLERAERWTIPRRLRRARAESHPVHDFLFDYYRYSAAKLGEWHPSPWEWLEASPTALERFQPPHYRIDGGLLRRDLERLSPKATGRLRWTQDLLNKTHSRSPWLGCFGVHEWAMVYGGEDIRHQGAATLRVSREEINQFVEERPIVCTHFDAFRFFSPAAQPMNRVEPKLQARDQFEQPGCIHANMDLYKWAYKSMPWIGSDLLWDAFELAVQLRELDMRASPYDLRPFGYEPVRVETAGGRVEYRRLQEALSDRSQQVRGRLIRALEELLSLAAQGPTA